MGSLISLNNAFWQDVGHFLLMHFELCTDTIFTELQECNSPWGKSWG